MVCVGVVSAILGKRSIWTVPASFVASMALGGVLGLNALFMPRAEAVIAISLVALGLAIATGGSASEFGRAVPPWLVILFVVFFGAAHGNAHGAEIPATASPIAFTVGFLCGTSGLHLVGVLVGASALRHHWANTAMRFSGIFTAALGVGFLTR